PEQGEKLVPGPIAGLRLGQRRSRARHELPSLLLEPPPLADVAGDLGRADDLAPSIPDRRDRQRDVDVGAVLADSNRLEVTDGLTAPEPGEDVILLGSPVGGPDEGDRVAEPSP